MKKAFCLLLAVLLAAVFLPAAGLAAGEKPVIISLHRPQNSFVVSRYSTWLSLWQELSYWRSFGLQPC